MTTYRNIVSKYQPQTNLKDGPTIQGFDSAALLVKLLQGMKQPTRKGLMDSMRSLKSFTSGVELPGISYNGSDKSNFLLTQGQLARFDGQRWATFGEVIDASKI